MSNHIQYLVVLGLCLVGTLPLELLIGARVYRQPRRLLITLVPVAVVFSLFDIGSIHWHWWHYAHRYVSDINLPGDLPLEELLFFIVIPICSLLTYEAVGGMRRRDSSPSLGSRGR
ncbi:MAG: lycopene cyclase domain-containing protein [Acidimicrobiales bacterium]